MWSSGKKHLQELSELRTSVEAYRGEVKGLHNDFVTLQERLQSWEIRMAEMQDKTLHAIQRHKMRDRREKGGNGVTGEAVEPDPITAKLQARRGNRHGIPSES